MAHLGKGWVSCWMRSGRYTYRKVVVFFADDAVSVETKLHQAFAAKRVNKINLRREFFYATPEEVLQVLKSTVGEVVQYTAEPEAEEYRLSRGAPDVVL